MSKIDLRVSELFIDRSRVDDKHLLGKVDSYHITGIVKSAQNYSPLFFGTLKNAYFYATTLIQIGEKLDYIAKHKNLASLLCAL